MWYQYDLKCSSGAPFVHLALIVLQKVLQCRWLLAIRFAQPHNHINFKLVLQYFIIGVTSEFINIPSASLLVHLSPGSYTINSHEKQLLGLDYLEKNTDVMENILKNLLLRDTEMWIWIIRVRAIVDYTIHIQVHVIEVRNLKQINQNYCYYIEQFIKILEVKFCI